MTKDDLPSWERETRQRERVEAAGKSIAAVRARVEQKRREKIAALTDVRLRVADAHMANGADVASAVAAHASALAEIAALDDALLALHVREAQAQLAQLEVEIATCEREIESAEKSARPHEAEIEKLQADLDKVSRKLGNQRVPDEETPELEKTQADLKASFAALKSKYHSPIRDWRDSVEKLNQRRKPLEDEIKTALAELNSDDADDAYDDAGAHSRARRPGMRIS